MSMPAIASVGIDSNARSSNNRLQRTALRAAV
jgi:hypothetical protein